MKSPQAKDMILRAIVGVLRLAQRRRRPEKIPFSKPIKRPKTTLATIVTISFAMNIRAIATPRSKGVPNPRRRGRLSCPASVHGRVMFMGEHEMGGGPRCYVRPPGTARAYLLLPLLIQLAEEAAGSTFVALALLGLLDVAPHVNQLTSMHRAILAWWRAQGANAEFWNDHGIAVRVCDWIDQAILNESENSKVLDSLELAETVDILVRCGTPRARGIEERLMARRKGRL